MNNERSDLVIGLAREFIQLAALVNTSWDRAFFRYCHDGGQLGSNASIIHNDNADLIDPFTHHLAFSKLNDISETLFQSTRKNAAVILLIVGNDFSYDVKFEYEDMSRWAINKIDGATGIPAGF